MSYQNPKPVLFDDPSQIKETQQIIAEKDGTSNENDYKKLDTVYFAFIDVLGFKQTFDDIRITNEEKKAEKFRSVFNYYFELMNAAKFMEKGQNTGCYAGQTSDSLYFYTERIDFLFQFIKIFSHFNLYAMSEDVFFRGGIAKGNLYQKEQYQFYGNSVIYAYLLESNISQNPIIIIDADTNKDLQQISEYKNYISINKNRNYLLPFYQLGKDIILDLNDDISKPIDKQKIIDNINKNKKNFEFDAKNYSKYVFLENEYNKKW